MANKCLQVLQLGSSEEADLYTIMAEEANSNKGLETFFDEVGILEDANEILAELRQ